MLISKKAPTHWLGPTWVSWKSAGLIGQLGPPKERATFTWVLHAAPCVAPYQHDMTRRDGHGTYGRSKSSASFPCRVASLGFVHTSFGWRSWDRRRGSCPYQWQRATRIPRAMTSHCPGQSILTGNVDSARSVNGNRSRCALVSPSAQKPDEDTRF